MQFAVLHRDSSWKRNDRIACFPFNLYVYVTVVNEAMINKYISFYRDDNWTERDKTQ